MTHEHEIKYWAEHPDGTKVWARPQSEDWLILGIPGWAPDVMYIVDDEWAELRKAQADGAMIQMLDRGSNIDLPKDWWKTSFYKIYKTGSPNNYCIKPKEWYEDIPKEGVICWVWDNYEDRKCLRLVVGFRQGAKYPFEGAVNGFIKETISNWKHAEPVKCNELYKRGRWE